MTDGGIEGRFCKSHIIDFDKNNVARKLLNWNYFPEWEYVLFLQLKWFICQKRTVWEMQSESEKKRIRENHHQLHENNSINLQSETIFFATIEKVWKLLNSIAE